MRRYLKILLIFILLFLLIPNAFAKENISIESVTLDSKSKNTIKSEATYEGLSIYFDIKFSKVTDYAKYKIVINNQSNEDYEITEDGNLNNSEYIIYEFSFENDLKKIQKSSKTTAYITIKYIKEVPEESFYNSSVIETNNIIIDLGNETIDISSNINNPIEIDSDYRTVDKSNNINNPKTGDSLFLIASVLIITAGISIILYKTTKKKRFFSIFIISIALLPANIYAIKKLQIKIESKIEIEEPYNLGKYLVRNYPQKFTKYEGQVTDKVETTTEAKNVYFIDDNDNYLVFNNYCWRIVRTTEYGGVKIIYNGQYNNTCTNDSNYIGTTKWCGSVASLNCLGYMHSNNAHEMLNINAAINNAIFGNDVEYKNGEYLLIDQSNEIDNNHHYTCNNTTGTCEKVRYYYKSSLYSYYTLLENGDKIEDAINKNLYNDVNQKDSDAKKMVENWFENKLIDYINYIDTNVYCNNREITNANETGFNPNGGNITSETDMLFNRNNDLSCNNITDQFSTNNEIAPLKYPIALLSIQEAKHSTDYIKDDKVFWTMSPSSFSRYAYMYVFSDESSTSDFYGRRNVRPVITLKNTNIIDSGQGSINDPYIIKTE